MCASGGRTPDPQNHSRPSSHLSHRDQFFRFRKKQCTSYDLELKFDEKFEFYANFSVAPR